MAAMRKITQDALNAFVAQKPFNRDNTSIIQYLPDTDVWDFLLHGKSLAYTSNKYVWVKLQKPQYHTRTTCERLNGILSHPGVNREKYKRFFIKNGVLYLSIIENGTPLDINMTKTSDLDKSDTILIAY